MEPWRWHCYADRSVLCCAVAADIITLANENIQSKGRFSIVLAGGTTPAAVYRLLVSAHTDWQCWHVYFGDERCVPVGDRDRNDTMAHSNWLGAVAIPPGQVVPIPAELGAEAGARCYRQELAGVDIFDLVLLGLGEDGHTASLFPGQDLGEGADQTVVAVFDAPKPLPERVSLGAARLSRAYAVFLLVTGDSKREALLRLRHGEPIPAAAVRPPAGVDIHTDVLLD